MATRAHTDAVRTIAHSLKKGELPPNYMSSARLLEQAADHLDRYYAAVDSWDKIRDTLVDKE